MLLPATTFLEHYDIAKGYGAYHLHLVQPVIAPQGEARPNHEVFRELGVRLGLIEHDSTAALIGEAGGLMDLACRLPGRFSAPLLAGGRRPPRRRAADSVRRRHAEDRRRTRRPVSG